MSSSPETILRGAPLPSGSSLSSGHGLFLLEQRSQAHSKGLPARIVHRIRVTDSATKNLGYETARFHGRPAGCPDGLPNVCCLGQILRVSIPSSLRQEGNSLLLTPASAEAPSGSHSSVAVRRSASVRPMPLGKMQHR